MLSSVCAPPVIYENQQLVSSESEIVMNAPITNILPVAIAPRALVRIVIVGQVDHGKSTLIGRLLQETGSLPDGKLEALKAMSARRGVPFEWSFLVDALQSERDQGITIDTSQIRFRTPTRDIVLIDAPGHTEFLRNMITGAAQADAAILIIDAAEGVQDQTRRHGYLLQLLGIRQVAVVINKMDRIDFDAQRFHNIENEIARYLSSLELLATAVIPICARSGDGVARHTPALVWHKGATVLQALDQFTPARPPELALRFPVQAVYKFDDRRIVAGRVETGRIAIGDEILLQPAGKTARVKSIEAWPVADESAKPRDAVAGQSVGITLDQGLFVERGNIISDASAPASTGRWLCARIFWLHKDPLEVGARILVRIGTAEANGVITAINNAIDPGRLAATSEHGLRQNHVGEIEITLSRPLACDPHSVNPTTGRIVLEFSGRIAGGGLVLAVGKIDLATPSLKSIRYSAASQTDVEVQAQRLAERFAEMSPTDRIGQLRNEISGKIIFTTSFGLEDQVILSLLSKRDGDIDVVTLDTGRLFPETYDLWAETERRFGRRIRAVYPHQADLEALVERQGINGFYDSREARVACCHVRKVEPLNRALAGARAWITGLRGDQSANRKSMGVVTFDTDRKLLKLNPLFDWSREQTLAFALANNVPVNRLHAKGFASIGCAPCTRAINPGEPERAGRWWWEQDEKKECGLHPGR